MQDFSVKKLTLVSPLKYVRDDSLQPFASDGAQGEFLFVFAQESAFPGRLVAAGAVLDGEDPDAEEAGEQRAGQRECLELPAGTYLFAQIRGAADREILISMMLQVQQEGIRQGFVLDERLYLRYLWEEGQPVVQVFRPVG
jgi:hypothetical protein